VGGAAVFALQGVLPWARLGALVAAALCIIAWLNLSNDAFDAATGVDVSKPESVVSLTGNRPLVFWSSLGFLAAGVTLLLRQIAATGDSRAPLALAGLFLACRTLFNAAANLTTNELINRGKYLYLNHEAVGYTNRFDRGVLHNCFQFWCHPHQDWWRLYDEGDRAMVRSSRTVLSIWSPGLLLRAIDLVS
ncbi:palmitoyltransferase, partial [Haematococcus lacustris]